MVTNEKKVKTVAGQTRLAQVGLACPDCDAIEAKTFHPRRTSKPTIRMACPQCGRALRDLSRGEVHYEAADRGVDHPACQPIPAGWNYQAYILLADGLWRPIAASATLEGAWAAALHSWQRGDVLIIPMHRE